LGRLAATRSQVRLALMGQSGCTAREVQCLRQEAVPHASDCKADAIFMQGAEQQFDALPPAQSDDSDSRILRQVDAEVRLTCPAAPLVQPGSTGSSVVSNIQNEVEEEAHPLEILGTFVPSVLEGASSCPSAEAEGALVSEEVRSLRPASPLLDSVPEVRPTSTVMQLDPALLGEASSSSWVQTPGAHAWPQAPHTPMSCTSMDAFSTYWQSDPAMMDALAVSVGDFNAHNLWPESPEAYSYGWSQTAEQEYAWYQEVLRQQEEAQNEALRQQEEVQKEAIRQQEEAQKQAWALEQQRRKTLAKEALARQQAWAQEMQRQHLAMDTSQDAAGDNSQQSPTPRLAHEESGGCQPTSQTDAESTSATLDAAVEEPTSPRTQSDVTTPDGKNEVEPGRQRPRRRRGGVRRSRGSAKKALRDSLENSLVAAGDVSEAAGAAKMKDADSDMQTPPPVIRSSRVMGRMGPRGGADKENGIPEDHCGAVPRQPRKQRPESGLRC